MTEGDIERELREFAADGRMPNVRQFRAAGKGPLERAIRRNGGAEVWRARLGLDAPLDGRGRRPLALMADEEAAAQARAVVVERGALVTSARLHQIGLPALARYVDRVGREEFAALHGFPLVPEPRWSEERIVGQLRDIGFAPTQKWMLDNGHGALMGAIANSGRRVVEWAAAAGVPLMSERQRAASLTRRGRAKK